ncbi:hypothetical protein [Acrocarpospora catenulata]|uniref:hypothetical protein n=1 Tax=Acrocarpospora catenulata TaxID=2836182 RepID=UPI001BDB348B|nr:hypothetical protein [Acrocarpospora catenulata]
MRTLTVALLALALAACGSTEPASSLESASTAPPPASAPAEPDPEPAPTPTETLTAREKAFIRAMGGVTIRDDVIEYDSSALIEGRQACGEGIDEYDDSSPPTLDVIIEKDLASDKTLRYAIKHLCPKYLTAWRQAQNGFSDGIYEVGKDIKPGTYRTTPGRITDCYWERSTPHGDIIDNAFVSNAPRGVIVTIRRGEGFKSDGCGNWMAA